MGRELVVLVVLVAGLVAVASLTGGALPVAVGLVLVLAIVTGSSRVRTRRDRADRYVLDARDTDELVRRIRRTDVRALTTFGFSRAHDLVAMAVARWDLDKALAVATDLVDRAGDDARLSANAHALRAVLHAQAGDDVRSLDDVSAAEAIRAITPTARARCELARLLHFEKKGDAEGLRRHLVRSAGLLHDCGGEVGWRVVRAFVRSSAHGSPPGTGLFDAEPAEPYVPRWELGASPRDQHRRATVAFTAFVAVALSIVAGSIAKSPLVWWSFPIFAATFAVAMERFAHKASPALLGAHERPACRAGWAGELDVHELEAAIASEEGCAVLARIAEREASFEQALALAERGLLLGRADRNLLSEIRSGVLAATGRTDEAREEATYLPRESGARERARFRVALYDAARAGDVARAAGVVRAATRDEPLFFRDEILAELAIALDERDAAKIARLREVAHADPVLGKWLGEVAPGFVTPRGSRTP